MTHFALTGTNWYQATVGFSGTLGPTALAAPVFACLTCLPACVPPPPPLRPPARAWKDTTVSQIEDAFNRLTARDDVAIVLINQHVANEIRHVLGTYTKTIPTVLEIPSKDVP